MGDFRIGILVFIAIAILVGGISAIAVFSDRGHNGMDGSGYMTAKEIHAVRVQLVRRNAAISSNAPESGCALGTVLSSRSPRQCIAP